jgi:site-specific recombinase XerD
VEHSVSPSERSRRPGSGASLHRLFPAKNVLDVSVRAHDLRHAHASRPFAGGADLKTLMDHRSHDQTQTIQKYLHALEMRIAAAWTRSTE